MSDNSLYINNFNGVFFLSLGTLFISAMGVCFAYALKSKCSNVKICFGCLEIDRDVELEADMEMNASTLPTTTSTTAVDDIPPSVVIRSRRPSKIITDNAVAAAIKALESDDDETKI